MQNEAGSPSRKEDAPAEGGNTGAMMVRVSGAALAAWRWAPPLARGMLRVLRTVLVVRDVLGQWTT